MFVCVFKATAKHGLVEICITKHPPILREKSQAQIEAVTIKEWLQDVRGGEREEGGV